MGTRDFSISEDVLKAELQPVLDLATDHLNYLLIASMSLRLFFNLRSILIALARNPGEERHHKNLRISLQISPVYKQSKSC